MNRLNEPTQIHWHGLEIEAPFDGVVGVGGYNGMPTPPIMPGDSFQVRYTPPPQRRTRARADMRVAVGEVYDVIVELPAPGGQFAPREYSLEMWGDRLLAKHPVTVRAPGS